MNRLFFNGGISRKMLTGSRTFDQTPIDRVEIKQRFLDLETRVRTNLFSWRGQFSPGLADILLSTYAGGQSLILDPFAGIGTTLVEAARKGLPCIGTEINPAAVAMAETVIFIPLQREQRKDELRRARTLLERSFDSHLPLFGRPGSQQATVNRLAELTHEQDLDRHQRNVITNILIRVAESDVDCDTGAIYRAFAQHSNIVEHLPHAVQEYRVENCDARELPLPDASIQFVLTSPPYINVFNYHQNSRRPMELLGWDLLDVAKSEFGSNRKHRGNRFFTVVQYCLDMHEMLIELRRVMKPTSRAIFVVGRESCVRGVSFQNGWLVSSLAELAGFKLSLRQERKFRNKFGAVIYEDLLHLTPSNTNLGRREEARSVAIEELSRRLPLNLKPDVAQDLRSAIEASSEISASPLYALNQESRHLKLKTIA